jgi:hypothetical protein
MRLVPPRSDPRSRIMRTNAAETQVGLNLGPPTHTAGSHQARRAQPTRTASFAVCAGEGLAAWTRWHDDDWGAISLSFSLSYFSR